MDAWNADPVRLTGPLLGGGAIATSPCSLAPVSQSVEEVVSGSTELGS